MSLREEGAIRVRQTVYRMAEALESIAAVCEPLEVAQVMERELMRQKRASTATPWGQLVAFLEAVKAEGSDARILIVPDHE